MSELTQESLRRNTVSLQSIPHFRLCCCHSPYSFTTTISITTTTTATTTTSILDRIFQTLASLPWLAVCSLRTFFDSLGDLYVILLFQLYQFNHRHLS